MKLTGTYVTLEVLQEHHRDTLTKIAQDERIWTYFPIEVIGEKFNIWFDKALMDFQKKNTIPFIVRLQKNNEIIGSTRFYEIVPEHKRLAIGYTWYIPKMWGTQINPECKLLLLTHAFEQLDYNRVEFYVDSRNLHSRAAIKKLGATEEGISRKHMILETGYVRDTVTYSIIKSEWSTIKEKLIDRVEKYKITS